MATASVLPPGRDIIRHRGTKRNRDDEIRDIIHRAKHMRIKDVQERKVEPETEIQRLRTEVAYLRQNTVHVDQFKALQKTVSDLANELRQRNLESPSYIS
jgi:hypothetical protein